MRYEFIFPRASNEEILNHKIHGNTRINQVRKLNNTWGHVAHTVKKEAHIHIAMYLIPSKQRP